MTNATSKTNRKSIILHLVLSVLVAYGLLVLLEFIITRSVSLFLNTGYLMILAGFLLVVYLVVPSRRR